jgi:trimeric autotransporter adhesin
VRSGSNSSFLDGNQKGTWGRVEAGIGGGTGGGPIVSAWADFGDTRGYGLRAGFRF